MNYTGHSMSRQTGDRATMIIPVIQHLRAFAHTLDDDRDRADGCVYAAVVKALHDGDWDRSETDVRLSLFTILYAQYFVCPQNGGPPKFGGTADQNPRSSNRLSPNNELPLTDFRGALQRLEPAHRAALILVGPAGFSYVDAARISSCAVETYRSLVDRALAGLCDMLGGVPPAEGSARKKLIRETGLRGNQRRFLS